MSLCRHAFQVQGRVTTWSWTCRLATQIIVSPPTGWNRSEVWLLPECKQSCSQKGLMFFISLLSPPPRIQICRHTLQQHQPPCCLNHRKFSRAAWKAEHAKTQPCPQSNALFLLCKALIVRSYHSHAHQNCISSGKTEKKKSPTRPNVRHRLGEWIHVNSPAPWGFTDCFSLSHL